MTTHLPLAGLKIAVTRPREQAASLARCIEEAGGIPLLFPLLEITAAADARKLNEQISRLKECDLVIFISPNAVKYGMAAIRSQGDIPQNLKIATVGLGSARALCDLGVDNVIAPVERFDSEGLLALAELQHIHGWRVMIFRGDGGRELLGDTLKARGAVVEYAACYRRSKTQHKIEVLLDADPDALTVTSSEALDNLWQMLDHVQRDSLCGLPLFVQHTRIAELARRQGWRRVLPASAGEDGLILALTKWAAQKSGIKVRQSVNTEINTGNRTQDERTTNG